MSKCNPDDIEILGHDFDEETHICSRCRLFRDWTLSNYENIKKMNLARRRTQSKYVRENLADNIREHSNGESADQYFSEKITEDGRRPF